MRIRTMLVVSTMLLAACSSASQLSPNQLDYYQAQQFSWESCPQDYFLKKDRRFENFNPANTLCTELEVPISYSDLSLGSKTIAMMGMGDSANPTVFYNPGGPGVSGIEAIQTIDFPVVLDRDYFIIGFDPRGVGRSTPVRCDDEADLESYYKYDLYIDSAAEAAVAESGYIKFIKECAAANPNWWSINTVNTVKDIELMRTVLADAPLNFIGSSYGTILAMEYIRAYPENIGKVMLDSPVLIGLDNDEDVLQQAKGFNDAFERLFAKCAADEKCPGTTIMGIIEQFKQKLIEADAGKVLGYWGVQQFPTNPNSTVGSANLILDGLYQMSYFEIDQIYAEFRRGLKDLLEKNDSWIFEFYGLVFHGYEPETKERSNMDEILYIVNCMDIDAREFKTDAEINEFDRKYAQVAPIVDYLYEAPNGFTWIPKRQGCEWSWLAFDDDSIPNPPAKVASPVNESGREVLIIASTGDNATPYMGAIRVAKQLKSPLITFEGTGHAIAFNGNSCITEQISNFFSSAAPLVSKTCLGSS